MELEKTSMVISTRILGSKKIKGKHERGKHK
jgi:hypothetical protein